MTASSKPSNWMPTLEDVAKLAGVGKRIERKASCREFLAEGQITVAVDDRARGVRQSDRRARGVEIVGVGGRGGEAGAGRRGWPRGGEAGPGRRAGDPCRPGASIPCVHFATGTGAQADDHRPPSVHFGRRPVARRRMVGRRRPSPVRPSALREVAGRRPPPFPGTALASPS